MIVGSSVEKIWPPSRPRGVAEACAVAFGTGGTIPRCEVSYGGSSSTSAIYWACGRARWKREAQRIPAHTVISQPKPLRPLRLPTVKRQLNGEPGCAVRIQTVSGTGQEITRHRLIVPGSAWPSSLPITKQSGTWRTAWRIRPSSLHCISVQARCCCCHRRGSHPARLRANTFTMLVGLIPHHYAHLVRKICSQYFLRPNSESTCSNVRNVRIVSCFCNGCGRFLMYYPGLVKALRTWYYRHRRKLLAGSKKNLEKWQQEQNM